MKNPATILLAIDRELNELLDERRRRQIVAATGETADCLC
jgi:hypothetical protein